MRFPGMLVLLAVFVLFVAAAVWLTATWQTGVGSGANLRMEDIPPGEVWSDTHGNWMKYFFWQGQLRWMVVATGVQPPDVPAADDTRPPQARFAELSVAGKHYTLSGSRNFYTLSPKRLTPAGHLVISLNFWKFLNRLKADEEKQGPDFNLVTTAKSFFSYVPELKEMLGELEEERP